LYFSNSDEFIAGINNENKNTFIVKLNFIVINKMPLYYIPLNINKCCEKLNIINSKYINKYIYDAFSEFYENTFCSFELTTGKNVGSICGSRIKNNEKYCQRHIKSLYKINTKKEIVEKKRFYCISKSCRRTSCGRLVKGPNEVCNFHKNKSKGNNYILNIDEFYFKEYKKYLYNIDNYDDIIYETYSSEYINYKKYLNNVNYNYDDIIYRKYKFDNEIVENIKSIDCNLPDYDNETLNISNNIENSLSLNKKKKKKKNKNKNKGKVIINNIDENINSSIDIKNVIYNINLNNNGNNKKEIDIILSSIEKLKYNKYIDLYLQFLSSNIKILLNLNDKSNNINKDRNGYSKVIIFNKNIELETIIRDIIYDIDDIHKNTITWFGNKLNIIDYNKKYNIDMNKNCINIYKIDDIGKINKLNIDSLLILYF
jgi:hypothetical protein